MATHEATAEHALNSGGFPQLRIMNNHQVNDNNEPYVSVGVLDSLGNTEWTEVTIGALFDALDEAKLISLLYEMIQLALTEER